MGNAREHATEEAGNSWCPNLLQPMSSPWCSCKVMPLITLSYRDTPTEPNGVVKQSPLTASYHAYTAMVHLRTPMKSALLSQARNNPFGGWRILVALLWTPVQFLFFTVFGAGSSCHSFLYQGSFHMNVLFCLTLALLFSRLSA